MPSISKKPPGRASSRVPAKRAPRPDGDATRAHLLETAGRVFAERGFADATGKEICERAGVPLASINYHFGSRDGLYEAVLAAAHQQLVGLEQLMALTQGIDDPAARLRAILSHLIELATRAGTPWGFRVLLREAMTPTAALPKLIQKVVRPKAVFMLELFGAVMGLPPEHPRVQRGLMFALLPCVVAMVMPKQGLNELLPAAARDSDDFALDFIRYAMAGLDAMTLAARAAPPAQPRKRAPARRARS
jgi:TetR/AcrR family transcriptional regulator, regulator of cefoperazone and chloramphenicol sensitivity